MRVCVCVCVCMCEGGGGICAAEVLNIMDFSPMANSDSDLLCCIQQYSV